MFKIVAAILICAVCMSPVVEGALASVAASASPAQKISPAIIANYAKQDVSKLLTPNAGPITSILGGAMPPRSYIGQSNPVLVRTPSGSTRFNGEAIILLAAL